MRGRGLRRVVGRRIGGGRKGGEPKQRWVRAVGYGREPTLPNGAAPAGGTPKVVCEASQNARQPRSIHSASEEGAAYGICQASIARGYRAVLLPYGQGHHVIHAKCVVEALVGSRCRRHFLAEYRNAGLAMDERKPLKRKFKRTLVFAAGLRE